MSLAGTLITLAIGVLAGSVTRLAGASGVIIVVPLLSILLGFSVHQSIGTSLLVLGRESGVGEVLDKYYWVIW